jgi:nitrate reductase gamma subunit
MNRAIGTALFVAGVVLIIAGFNASQSFSSDVSRFFTGTATNKAMWMLTGGIAAAVAGSILLSRRNAP